MDVQSERTADSSLVEFDDLQQLHAGPLNGVEDLGSRGESVDLLPKHDTDHCTRRRCCCYFFGEGGDSDLQFPLSRVIVKTENQTHEILFNTLHVRA